jgi:HSP20 family protein
MLVKKVYNRVPSLFGGLLNDELFDLPVYRKTAGSSNCPSVNIMEDKKGYQIELAVPGFSKNDFKIELDNDVLTISSDKKEDKKDKKNEEYMRREFCYQSFSRSFDLPENVDGDKIEANYKDGILRVSVPVREEAKPKPPKQIEIA